MTNILSILGKVNGGGRGVYGDWEKWGGFRAKGGFRMRSADPPSRGTLWRTSCGVRIGGGKDCLLRIARCVFGGAVARSLLRIQGYLPLIAANCAYLRILGNFLFFWERKRCRAKGRVKNVFLQNEPNLKIAFWPCGIGWNRIFVFFKTNPNRTFTNPKSDVFGQQKGVK